MACTEGKRARRTRPRETEASFQRAVCELAALGGWRVFHPWLSVRSSPGFPDLVLVQPGSATNRGRLIFAEIKTNAGKVTPSQAEWLELLQSVEGIETYVWRPADWPAIAARLLPPGHPC